MTSERFKLVLHKPFKRGESSPRILRACLTHSFKRASMNYKDFVPSQPQREPKLEKRSSQGYLWVWPMSNGGYYKLTHRNPAESLKELCQLGQKRTETLWKKKSPVDPHSCMWKNQEDKVTTQSQTWIFFNMDNKWWFWGESRAPGLIPILEYRLNFNCLKIVWLFHSTVSSMKGGTLPSLSRFRWMKK